MPSRQVPKENGAPESTTTDPGAISRRRRGQRLPDRRDRRLDGGAGGVRGLLSGMPGEGDPGMAVQTSCAYIIPPNRNMAFLNGRLELLDPSEPRGQRLSIDFSFRSLADDEHERAIGCLSDDGRPAR